MTGPALALMRRVPLLSGFTEAELEQLAATTEPRRARAGEVLFAAGDAADSAFLVSEGDAELVSRAGVKRCGVGVLLGERALLAPGRRLATARAATGCAVLEIQRAPFRTALEAARTEARRAAAAVMTARLDALNRDLEALRRRFAGE